MHERVKTPSVNKRVFSVTHFGVFSAYVEQQQAELSVAPETSSDYEHH